MGPKPKATKPPAKSRKKTQANLAAGVPVSNVPIILEQEEGQEIQVNELLPPNPQPSPTNNEEIDDAK
jgi:hypothetical protein